MLEPILMDFLWHYLVKVKKGRHALMLVIYDNGGGLGGVGDKVANF